MKYCIYVILLLSVFLWLEHGQIGFLHTASLCYNGDIISSLFIIKVVCESIGLVSSFIMLCVLPKLWTAILLSIFIILVLLDVIFWMYSINRDDDYTPKAMIIYPGGVTLEVTELKGQYLVR